MPQDSAISPTYTLALYATTTEIKMVSNADDITLLTTGADISKMCLKPIGPSFNRHKMKPFEPSLYATDWHARTTYIW